MGIGCRRDPLEANVWYVKAADQGEDRAKLRIAAIRAAASGGGSAVPAVPAVPAGRMATGVNRSGTNGKEEEEKGKKKWGIF